MRATVGAVLARDPAASRACALYRTPGVSDPGYNGGRGVNPLPH